MVIEPNRGARVAGSTRADLRELYELRLALELEAAHLALERHGGRLPKPVHDAVRLMAAVCEQPARPWSAVVDAHDHVHSRLVAAARSPRLERAYATLTGELRLFVIQLKPSWSLDRMAEQHARLIADLERHGPEPLRAHFAEGRADLAPGRTRVSPSTLLGPGGARCATPISTTPSWRRSCSSWWGTPGRR